MQQLRQDTKKNELQTLLPRFPEPLLAAREQLAAFAAALFRPDDLVELRMVESWMQCERARSKLIARSYLPASKLGGTWPRLREMNAAGANVYFGVNPRARREGKKSAVKIVSAIWADVDGVGCEEATARFGDVLHVEPSITVSSGRGAHLYWLLDPPFVIESKAHRERFERMLSGIYKAARCDAVQDVSRVLRLPGLWNVKGLRNGAAPLPCQLVACDPGRAYPLSAFAAWWDRANKMPPREATEARSPLARPPSSSEPDAEELLAELDRHVSDRSRRDYAVILGLLRLGLSPEDILPLASGKSKFRERGKAYFDLTIKNALRMVPRDA